MRTTLVSLTCLFGLLFAVYGLSYSGAFTADDEHLFVSGAQSLAQWGQLEAPQVYGNTRFHDEWRDVEPAQPILGALLVAWGDVQGLGRAQAPFILNSIVTALTACVVFLAARVRASFRTALIVALLYGLATTAWPYAKTYYRDPLAALLLAIAYWGYELARGPARRAAGISLIVFGIAGGLLAKTTVAVALLAIPVAAMLESGRGLFSWPRLKWSLVVAAALVIVAVIISISLPTTGSLNRFSWPYLSFVLRYFIEAPHNAFGEALLGPLISPGRSIFLYSPPLLLACLSLLINRTRWRTWLAPWLIALGLIVLQALFYNEAWWGHANWGLRFILPAVPLLAVACAPAIEAYWRRGRWFIATLSLVGFLVQLGGVAVNSRSYLASLFEAASDRVPQLAVWQPSTSAILSQWQMMLQPQGIDVAWVRLLPLNTLPVILMMASWLSLFALCLYGLHQTWMEAAIPIPALFVSATLIILLPSFMLWALAPDPLYFGNRRAFTASLDYLNQSTSDGDVVLVQAYGEPIWHYFINQSRLPVRWYSLPIKFPTGDELDQFLATSEAATALDPATIPLLTRLAGSACRLWLVNEPDSAPESFELERAWLAAHYPVSADREFADESGYVRVTTFILDKNCEIQLPIE